MYFSPLKMTYEMLSNEVLGILTIIYSFWFLGLILHKIGAQHLGLLTSGWKFVSSLIMPTLNRWLCVSGNHILNASKSKFGHVISLRKSSLGFALQLTFINLSIVFFK